MKLDAGNSRPGKGPDELVVVSEVDVLLAVKVEAVAVGEHTTTRSSHTILETCEVFEVPAPCGHIENVRRAGILSLGVVQRPRDYPVTADGHVPEETTWTCPRR